MKRIIPLAGLLLALNSGINLAETPSKSIEKTTQTKVVDKKEIKSNGKEEIKGPRESLEWANYELLNFSFHRGGDATLFNYNRIITDFLNTDYAKNAKFMNIAILYSNCSSELSVISEYIKVLVETQKALENIISINKGKKMMGDKKIEDIEKEDKIKKCLRLIKKGLGTRGTKSSEAGSELEWKVRDYEKEKGNSVFFVKEYKDFLYELNREMGYKIREEPPQAEWREDFLEGLEITNKEKLKKYYFFKSLLKFQDSVIETEDFFQVNPLTLNVNLGQMFSVLAVYERNIKIIQEDLDYRDRNYSGRDGQSSKDFAKERFEKAIEITRKMKGSESYDIKNKIEEMIKELE